MTTGPTDPLGTAFTVSVDLVGATTTGISAADRAATIRALADPATRPADLRRPGHVFPLRARPGGVLERPGHTEAAVDLARLAGGTAAAVLCEVVSPDRRTMASSQQLRGLADRHGLSLISIADLAAYRARTEPRVRRGPSSSLATRWGPFTAIAYESSDGIEHLALVTPGLGEPGTLGRADAPLVRLHSECLTGDVFSSHRCDCGDQLAAALAQIAADRYGAVVYLRGHEGRGIGLAAKLSAYALQDQGYDTVDANRQLGLPVDARRYDVAAAILGDLGLPRRLRLLTNNPCKERALAEAGFEPCRVPLEVPATAANRGYLATKRNRMGHLLTAVAAP